MKRKVRRVQIVQPADLFIRYIPLTQGQFAIVDAADYEWLNQWNWCAVWQPNVQNFYAQRAAQSGKPGATVKMHRMILGLDDGDVRQGDHKEPSETLDNRRSNLRIATHGQNMQNRRRITGKAANKSGIKGVGWCEREQKWVVTIRHDGKSHYVGSFSIGQIDDAAKAYAEAANRLHGEFARAK